MRNYPSWVTQDSEKRLHDDFRLFAWFIWRHLKLPEPTPLQYDIASFLQHGPRRRMIEAFRGCGKSWLTAAYVLWLLYRDPQHKVMVVSASKERADAFSIFVKRLISDVPMLRFLEPRPGQRDSNIAFDVGPADPDQSPSVKSVGITGQLTGSRANTIIPDDIEVPKNSYTEQQREKLGELIKEFDAVIKPGGEIVYLGTPQCEQSIYNKLPERGFTIRVWPAEYTDGLDKEGVDRYQGRLAPFVTGALQADSELRGTPTEPSRFDVMDLLERRTSYGAAGYALQFMLDTSLADADRYPLKLRDLIVMDVDPKRAPVQLSWASSPDLAWEGIPNVGLNGDRLYRPMWASEEWAEYTGSVMFIDPAGRGADETAYCVGKMLGSTIFVTRWGGFAGGYDSDTLYGLAHIARDEGVNAVHVEGNFGDGMFVSLLKPVLAKIHPCHLEEYKVHGQKELRIIDKLEPVLNGHRLVIDRGVLEKDVNVSGERKPSQSGAFQLAHITRDRGALLHDDRLDCLAEMVGYWTSQLAVDVEANEQRHLEELREKELRKFMEEFGVTDGGPRWARI